ncbi:hypothetical protein BXO88_08730 [Oribacterium sp. C9]|nr:hypothetical protein BXO88_08730 [Oribacterium sp. C9]
MGRKIRLSQAMIVKNEEKNIERALSWGKGIVSEQIVVDTGSEDKTVEIAEAMGAKVYHFDWIDDFSAAKNYAIEKCTGNWIAFLDADEYFNSEDARKILEYIRITEDNGGEGIFSMLINLDDKGKIDSSASHIRIFKKLKNLRYKRRIHEELCYDDGHEIKVMDATKALTIWHTGYQTDVYREKKASKRNLNLILKEIEENPEQYEMYYYLGNEYCGADDFEKAEEAYTKYIDHLPDEITGTDATAANAFRYRLHCLLQQGKENETIIASYKDAIQRIKENADIPYAMGKIFFNAGFYSEAYQAFLEALDRLEKYGTINKSEIAMQNISTIYELLSEACLKVGDMKNAVKYSSSIISVNKYSAKGLVVLLRAFKGEGKNPVPVKDVINYLSKIYDFNDAKDISMIKAAAEAVGYEGMSEFLT